MGDASACVRTASASLLARQHRPITERPGTVDVPAHDVVARPTRHQARREPAVPRRHRRDYRTSFSDIVRDGVRYWLGLASQTQMRASARRPAKRRRRRTGREQRLDVVPVTPGPAQRHRRRSVASVRVDLVGNLPRLDCLHGITDRAEVVAWRDRRVELSQRVERVRVGGHRLPGARRLHRLTSRHRTGHADHRSARWQHLPRAFAFFPLPPGTARWVGRNHNRQPRTKCLIDPRSPHAPDAPNNRRGVRPRSVDPALLPARGGVKSLGLFGYTGGGVLCELHCQAELGYDALTSR